MTVGMRKAFAKSEMEVKLKEIEDIFFIFKIYQLIRDLYKLY